MVTHRDSGYSTYYTIDFFSGFLGMFFSTHLLVCYHTFHPHILVIRCLSCITVRATVRLVQNKVTQEKAQMQTLQEAGVCADQK